MITMKLSISFLLILAAAAAVTAESSRPRIPRSLSKAAREASFSNRKLRQLQKSRVHSFFQTSEASHIPLVALKKEGAVSPGTDRSHRELENTYQNNGQQQNGNRYGYDMYYASDMEAQYYNYNMNMEEQDFGFDITQYSFHYTGCSAIKSYSDTMAQDEGSNTVLVANRMATFRLCPTDQCQSNSYSGCTSNYGEYVTPMDQFLLGMYQLEEERVVAYCEMCQECSTREAFSRWYSELQYHKEYVVQASENSYEQFKENYDAQYGYNNNNADEGYNDYDSAAAQAYYKKLMNGNYANNYVYGNQQYNNKYGNNGNNYYQNANGDNSDGNENANYNNQNTDYNDGDKEYQEYQSQNQGAEDQYWMQNNWNAYNMMQYQSQGGDSSYYSAASSWSSMGAWYGNKIVNGYYEYSDDGTKTFVEEWGYVDQNGDFKSLEGDDAIKEMTWDNIPDGWSDLLEAGGDVEQCSYSDAGSCYNQFLSCMQVLGQADDYEDLIEEYNQQMYGDSEEEDEARRATIDDFLACNRIEFYGGDRRRRRLENQNNNNANGDVDNYWQANVQYDGQYDAYTNDDGETELYIGPFCNGDTITLGIYSDGYCSNHVQGLNAADVLGYDPTEDATYDVVPTECVSCAYDAYSETWYTDEEVEGTEDGVEPMCSILYQVAAKCNKNLNAAYTSGDSNNDSNSSGGSNNSANQQRSEDAEDGEGEEGEDWMTMYQSRAQYENEVLVCSYIESLKSNTYDEGGEIILSNVFSVKNWISEIKSQNSYMHPGLKAGLVLSALAAMGMGVWACTLLGRLSRASPKRKVGEEPATMGGKGSGTLELVSPSNSATAPLV